MALVLSHQITNAKQSQGGAGAERGNACRRLFTSHRNAHWRVDPCINMVGCRVSLCVGVLVRVIRGRNLAGTSSPGDDAGAGRRIHAHPIQMRRCSDNRIKSLYTGRDCGDVGDSDVPANTCTHEPTSAACHRVGDILIKTKSCILDESPRRRRPLGYKICIRRICTQQTLWNIMLSKGS